MRSTRRATRGMSPLSSLALPLRQPAVAAAEEEAAEEEEAAAAEEEEEVMGM